MRTGRVLEIGVDTCWSDDQSKSPLTAEAMMIPSTMQLAAPRRPARARAPLHRILDDDAYICARVVFEIPTICIGHGPENLDADTAARMPSASINVDDGELRRRSPCPSSSHRSRRMLRDGLPDETPTLGADPRCAQAPPAERGRADGNSDPTRPSRRAPCGIALPRARRDCATGAGVLCKPIESRRRDRAGGIDAGGGQRVGGAEDILATRAMLLSHATREPSKNPADRSPRDARARARARSPSDWQASTQNTERAAARVRQTQDQPVAQSVVANLWNSSGWRRPQAGASGAPRARELAKELGLQRQTSIEEHLFTALAATRVSLAIMREGW